MTSRIEFQQQLPISGLRGCTSADRTMLGSCYPTRPYVSKKYSLVDKPMSQRKSPVLCDRKMPCIRKRFESPHTQSRRLAFPLTFPHSDKADTFLHQYCSGCSPHLGNQRYWEEYWGCTEHQVKSHWSQIRANKATVKFQGSEEMINTLLVIGGQGSVPSHWPSM